MKIKSIILSALMMFGVASYAQEQFLAEVRLFAGNFPPKGWYFCEGQVLSISQNQALFSLLGCTYGGDCKSTFALPDLRGRVAVHSGYAQPIGLQKVNLGEQGGVETNVVTPNVVTAQTTGTSLDAATTGRDGAPSVVQSVVVKNVSLNQELNNKQPYLGLNYIICVEGYYPSRW